MHEQHENEQYFFQPATVDRLATFAAAFRRPCCVCAPTVGQELAAREVNVRVLDIDERFSDVPGFRRWDLFRAEWTGEEYGLIVCDPPFFNVSLSQLFRAMRVLARNDFSQPILMSYLVRRTQNVLGTFHPFGLQPTPFHPEYRTVRKCERNDIVFFSNLNREELRSLA